MKTIPDEHLFTVRGRPVMFRKDEEFFGALHATERGNFPVSHTGFYSLSHFTLCAHEQRIGFLDLLSENFLASIAAEQDRQTSEVLRDIVQCSRKDAADQNTLIHCLECASRAFEHGLFATDTQRRQLWQAAHEPKNRSWKAGGWVGRAVGAGAAAPIASTAAQLFAATRAPVCSLP